MKKALSSPSSYDAGTAKHSPVDILKDYTMDHFHGYTRDVYTLWEFYYNAFGIDGKISDLPAFGERTLRIQFPNSPLIEYCEIYDPDSDMAKLLTSRKEGLTVVDWRVNNLDKGIEQLESAGVKLIGIVQFGQLRQAWFEYSKDFGIQIELSEYIGANADEAAGMPGERWIVFRDEWFSEQDI